MKLFEAKQILKENGYRLIKESIEKDTQYYSLTVNSDSNGTTVDLYLKIKDHSVFDELLEFLDNFGDVDQPVTVEDLRNYDGKTNGGCDWHMSIYFDGEDKPDYTDENNVTEIITDWLSQFNWEPSNIISNDKAKKLFDILYKKTLAKYQEGSNRLNKEKLFDRYNLYDIFESSFSEYCYENAYTGAFSENNAEAQYDCFLEDLSDWSFIITLYRYVKYCKLDDTYYQRRLAFVTKIFKSLL